MTLVELRTPLPRGGLTWFGISVFSPGHRIGLFFGLRHKSGNAPERPIRARAPAAKSVWPRNGPIRVNHGLFDLARAFKWPKRFRNSRENGLRAARSRPKQSGSGSKNLRNGPKSFKNSPEEFKIQSPEPKIKIQACVIPPRWSGSYNSIIFGTSKDAPTTLEGAGTPRSTVACSGACCVERSYARRRQMRRPRLAQLGFRAQGIGFREPVARKLKQVKAHLLFARTSCPV